jgi:hypothetical protein
LTRAITCFGVGAWLTCPRGDTPDWKADAEQASACPTGFTERIHGSKIRLNQGGNAIVVVAAGENGISSEIYTVEVTRNMVGNFSQRAYIKAGATAGGFECFGAAVVLNGGTLAVGAPRDNGSATGVGGDQSDNSAIASGAVCVFGD